MSAIPQTDLWVEFFNTYRQLPALWKVTDEVYKNQRMRKMAYDRLLCCYQKIDPMANVDGMRRRINGIRTCFRREQRKVEQNEHNGLKQVYVPHLWYYNELSFLHGVDNRTAQGATVAEASDSFFNEPENEEENSNNEIVNDKDYFSEKDIKCFEHSLPEIAASPVHQPMHQIASPVHQPMHQTPMELSTPTVESSQNPMCFQPNLSRISNLNYDSRDEAAIYAEGWAISYRKLDEKNKLLAKKAIEEILVLGQLNRLEFNSVKMPN